MAAHDTGRRSFAQMFLHAKTKKGRPEGRPLVSSA
jgi:hypothetical protein